MKVLILVGLLVCTGGETSAQPGRISRLKAEIVRAASPEQKRDALLAFCDEWESYSPDTLKKYSRLARAYCDSFPDTRAVLKAGFYEAAWLFQVNKLDTAFARSDQVLKAYTAAFPYDDFYVKLYGLRGNILNRTNKLTELMAHNFELIGLAETARDTLGRARGMIGIGNVNLKLKKFDEALRWYHDALALMKNPLHKARLSFVYNNLGITFFHLNKEDSALYYVRQGIRYSREGEQLTDLANSLFLHGGLLSEYKKLPEAEASFREAIEVRKNIGDIYYLVTDMGQLAFFYANNNKPGQGIALSKEAIYLAEKNGPMYSNMSSLYDVLAKNYLQAGDYPQYSKALLKVIELKDSTYAVNTAEQMADLETRFEVQKKEATIANQKLKLIRRNLWIYGSLAAFLLLLTGGWFIFRNFRRRHKQKMEQRILEEKKQAGFAVKEAAEKERKRIAADLHDNLGVQANAILYNAELLKQEGTQKEELVGDLHETAREMLQNLRETLWVMRSADIPAKDAWLRVISFCQQMGRHYRHIRFSAKGNPPGDMILPSSKALNLVMIIQEAVNNAARHGEASLVEVTSTTSPGSWELAVTDNGKGFVWQEALDKQDSHGMHTMRERAHASGLKMDIDTAPGKGTLIRLQLSSATA